MRLADTVLPARIRHIHPAEQRAERRGATVFEGAWAPTVRAGPLLRKIDPDLVRDHELLQCRQELLALGQGQPQRLQAGLGARQVGNLLPVLMAVIVVNDELDAEVHVPLLP